MTKKEAIAYIQGKIDLPDEVIEALRDEEPKPISDAAEEERRSSQMLSREEREMKNE